MLTVAVTTLADATDIGAQTAAFFELALSPTGLALITIGVTVITALLVSRFGTVTIGASCLFLLSMMRLESRYVDNTLIQPLQTMRDFSRPLSLALVLALAARTVFFQRGDRRQLMSLACLAFLAFQTYFLFMVGVFADIPRAALGFVSVMAIMIAYVLGLGRLLQPSDGGRAYIRMFTMAGTAYVAANIAQLGLGYSNAILKGRLGGISGNPQQLAATCCVFAIFFAHMFAVNRTGSPAKWFGAGMLGILTLFILWSGSRTGALGITICITAYFRSRIGRLAILGAVAAAVLMLMTTFFSESTFGTDRFFYGGDTRSAVWLGAIDEFVRSPLVGAIPTSGDDGMNYSESSYLRTLAMLGLIGGVQMLMLIVMLVINAWRCWRIAQHRPDLAPIVDIVIAATAFMLFVNTFEGFMFGILTFFTIFIYSLYAMSAFVIDARDAEVPERAGEDDSLPALGAG